MLKNKPFLLRPAFKDYLWGGGKLRDDYGKDTEMTPLAESWECSIHPDGESIIASGEHEGKKLSEVLKLHPEYLGTHPGKQMPILVKLIDAKKDLSVQVHPSDEYAMEHEGGQLGKTEMWYVLHANPGAKLVYGFKRNVTADEVREAIINRTISSLLQFVPVHPNDVFLIEAGIVHAIGAGIVMAEIQENSNLTYRLYDYDRLDKNGNKRELHIDKALEVARFSSSLEPVQPMRKLEYKRGKASELLARCRYFQTERLLLNTERRPMAEYVTGSTSFHTLLCLEGCGILYGDKICVPFFRGDCIFIPADSILLRIHGKAQMLDIGC